MRTVLFMFGLLTDLDVDWMARTGARFRVADGEILIREGQPIDSIILLLEGSFSVTVNGMGEVARLGAGEVIGEISMVDSAPPSATVTARGSGLVLALDKTAVFRKLATDPAFGCRFYRALAVFLADRLRRMDKRTDDDGRILHQQGISKDELDVTVLDNVSMAGNRFDRMLRTLSSQA